MKLGIPQIIYICLMSYSILNELSRHGETKKPSKYNFFTTLISAAILITLLIYGGFFK
jgi:hypothetical protein